MNKEIVHDEVDIPGSPHFKGLLGDAPLERGISLVEEQQNPCILNSEAKRRTVRVSGGLPFIWSIANFNFQC